MSTQWVMVGVWGQGYTAPLPTWHAQIDKNWDGGWAELKLSIPADLDLVGHGDQSSQ